MLWWAEVCLLVVLVPIAVWQGSVALHSLRLKGWDILKDEEGGFRDS